MNELNELRDQAYENSLIYKEKTKKIHDSKIKNRVIAILSLDHFVEIPSGESKIHIKVLSMLWGNRLPIPDGSLPLSRPSKGKVFRGIGYQQKDKNKAKADKTKHDTGKEQEIEAEGAKIEDWDASPRL
ncbi:hypothetical protein Tco_1228867 [Tanacetum coccineum]